MIKNSRRVKYKNDTSDMLNEIARRMGVSVQTIQKPFQSYWQDVGIMFTHQLGHGVNIENFCNMILYVQGVDKFAAKIEKQIFMDHRILDKFHEKVAPNPPEQIPDKIKSVCFQLNDYLTRLVMLRCSLNLYEQEVLASYPKKYKPKRVLFDKLITRLEEFYNVPITEFPVQISHPIQEVFVQKLQKKGILPNPVIYKNQEMHPMRMHYKSKDSVSAVQLPFKYMDKTN